MLVITRKKNEAIVINDEIVVVIVDIRADKVRIGIEFPKEISVHRKEVWEAIKSKVIENPKNSSKESPSQEEKNQEEEK